MTLELQRWRMFCSDVSAPQTDLRTQRIQFEVLWESQFMFRDRNIFRQTFKVLKSFTVLLMTRVRRVLQHRLNSSAGWWAALRLAGCWFASGWNLRLLQMFSSGDFKLQVKESLSSFSVSAARWERRGPEDGFCWVLLGSAGFCWVLPGWLLKWSRQPFLSQLRFHVSHLNLDWEATQQSNVFSRFVRKQTMCSDSQTLEVQLKVQNHSDNLHSAQSQHRVNMWSSAQLPDNSSAAQAAAAPPGFYGAGGRGFESHHGQKWR